MQLKQAPHLIAGLRLERIANEAKPLESRSQTRSGPLLANLIIGVLGASARPLTQAPTDGILTSLR